jgi:16S rRNA (guanine527-N7)-methyltransferase
MDDAVEQDPLDGDPRVAKYFGASFDAVAAFAGLLREHAIERGLLGPRELSRLWERHLLNSAAVVPFLKPGALADVGSGAGLPGLVIACMQPDRPVTLLEPMERRAAWLEEASTALGLRNVEVIRARAEDVPRRGKYEAVTARAVAPVVRLIKWCAPLLTPSGEMVLLKGRSAQEELTEAGKALTAVRLLADVVEAPTLPGLEATRVVLLRR